MAMVKSNGHVTDHVTWPERPNSCPNTLRAEYLVNSWTCYLEAISNYMIICCEAVRSAIPATAWLFVEVYCNVWWKINSIHRWRCGNLLYLLFCVYKV